MDVNIGRRQDIGGECVGQCVGDDGVSENIGRDSSGLEDGAEVSHMNNESLSENTQVVSCMPCSPFGVVSTRLRFVGGSSYNERFRCRE